MSEETERRRSFRVSGPLTDATIARLMAVVREADDEQPRAIFAVAVTDDTSTLAEAERMLQEMLPPLRDRLTTFAAAARKGG